MQKSSNYFIVRGFQSHCKWSYALCVRLRLAHAECEPLWEWINCVVCSPIVYCDLRTQTRAVGIFRFKFKTREKEKVSVMQTYLRNYSAQKVLQFHSIAIAHTTTAYLFVFHCEIIASKNNNKWMWWMGEKVVIDLGGERCVGKWKRNGWVSIRSLIVCTCLSVHKIW